MFSWQHNPLVLSHPVWSVIPLGHIQHQLKYWDKALDPFIVWVNQCVAWWRITDQSVDNWQILFWDYRHCRFTLISENEMRIEENHHCIPYIYLSSLSHWGLANVQVRLWGQQLWGNAVKKQKTSLCASHWVVFFRAAVLSVTRVLKFQPSRLMFCCVWWWPPPHFAWQANLLWFTSSSLLLPAILFSLPTPHPTTSLLPHLLFLLPPSFWSIWSIARKPGNQSGRFLSGTTVLLFFLSQFAAALCRAVLHSSEHKNWARIGSSYAKVFSLFN